jgi:GNAT superfamily N-acetyltransferase
VRSLPGEETLIACWSALARTSPAARLIRTPATAAAIFPSWLPLNNAIMPSSDEGAAGAAAVELAELYAGEGVDQWALWLPSGQMDLDAPDTVREVGGLERDTTTLVMSRPLSEGLPSHASVVRVPMTTIVQWTDDAPVSVPDLEIATPVAEQGLTAWAGVHDGLAVTGAWSFVHAGDCGIYGVETVSGWRRRGFARSLVEHMLADAYRRGARTATLQSTRMGQPLYESLGFAAAGRYEEWVSRGSV